MSELKNFLGQLRSEGTVETPGVFTISQTAAQDKLRKFTLERNELYIVQFVAAAVAGGASFISFSTGLTYIEIVFDGAAPNRYELENLGNYLFSTLNTPEYLSELALGVYSALELPASKIILESFSEEQAWRLEVTQDKHRLAPISVQSPLRPLLRVIVDKGTWLNARLTSRHPERHELHICRFANLSMTFDDEELFYTHRKPPYGIHNWALLSGPRGIESIEPSSFQRSIPNAYGYLALAPRHVAQKEKLYLVHNGIAFAWKPSNFGPSNLIGIVHVQGLRKDISRSGLVADKAFEDMSLALGHVGWELLCARCEDSTLSPRKQRELQSHVEQALAHLRLPEPLRPPLSAWLAARAVSKMTSPEEHLKAVMETRQLAAAGDVDGAKKVRGALLTVLQKALVASFEDGNLDSVSELLDPLCQLLVDFRASERSHCLQIQDIVTMLLPDQEPTYHGFQQPSGYALHRLGLMFRYQGKLVEAASSHVEAARFSKKSSAWALRYRAEIELAGANYGEAEALLEKAQDILPDCRDLAEERAFLKRLVSPEGKKACVSLLHKSLPEQNTDPFLQWLYLDWLVREGRGILPWTTWLEFRARTSMLEVTSKLSQGTRSDVEAGLDPNFDLLGWQSLQQARQARVSSVTVAEKQFGALHPYTQFSRRRAIYQLHRLEAHQLADRLHCRGHLLAQVRYFIDSLLES